jgi:hypothetical protein
MLAVFFKAIGLQVENLKLAFKTRNKNHKFINLLMYILS